MTVSNSAFSRFLLINGPNLGRLGQRLPEIYGSTSLCELEATIRNQAENLGVMVECFQSDTEGDIIKFIDEHRSAEALILNPGALMMSGWCLRDCLEDFAGVKIEVHISQIFAREGFRHSSVIADVMDCFLCGFGTDGYQLAFDAAVRLWAKRNDSQ